MEEPPEDPGGTHVERARAIFHALVQRMSGPRAVASLAPDVGRDRFDGRQCGARLPRLGAQQLVSFGIEQRWQGGLLYLATAGDVVLRETRRNARIERASGN